MNINAIVGNYVMYGWEAFNGIQCHHGYVIVSYAEPEMSCYWPFSDWLQFSDFTACRYVSNGEANTDLISSSAYPRPVINGGPFN